MERNRRAMGLYKRQDGQCHPSENDAAEKRPHSRRYDREACNHPSMVLFHVAAKPCGYPYRNAIFVFPLAYCRICGYDKVGASSEALNMIYRQFEIEERQIKESLRDNAIFTPPRSLP